MPRVHLIDPETIPSQVRTVLERRVKARGQSRVSEIFRTLAHVPAVAAAQAESNMVLYDALPIGGAVREAMILRIANCRRARYVHGAHVDIGRRAGLSDAQIAAVADYAYRQGDLFSAEDIALIDYAEQLTTDPHSVDQTLADAMISRYGEGGFVAITLLVAQYTSSCVYTTAMDLTFTP